jgi:predicted dinucleotide-binding enzyme
VKIAVLGTGTVGATLASKLVTQGHAVIMGSRTADNAAATAWAAQTGGAHGTFADAATGADLVFLCAKGEHAIGVLSAAGDLSGKVVVDLSNPLDFSQGFPPRLFVSNDASLAERIQAAFPAARLVKSLNTVSSSLMTDPGALGASSTIFVAGDDTDAKALVADVLRSWGWDDVIDLGGIAQARGLEAWLLLWTRLYGALGTAEFNLKIVRGDG